MSGDSRLPADPLDDLPGNAVIAVAMSGGVDSSVAAMRCVDRGFETIGITLAMWAGNTEQVKDKGCCSIDSVDDARRVCSTLGIAHYAWNLEDAFREEVILNFEEEYASGRTPNPCVRCNDRIKFGVLLERATAAGATHVATGHYAQRGHRRELWTLHRSRDAKKDQSYTLHRLDQRQLAQAVFPLGALDDKVATRRLAMERGLVTAAKPDSQDLCFVEGMIGDDLRRRLDGRFAPGAIVNTAGDVLGEHKGLPFYTVGQRAGLAIAPSRSDAPAWYVTALDPATNSVVVGNRDDLARGSLEAAEARWISGSPPATGTVVSAQLRAHGQPHSATIRKAFDEVLHLDFDPGVGPVSPGQPVVIYRDNEVIGGAINV